MNVLWPRSNGDEGRSLQLQRKVALVKYLLYQVRRSRSAYYPQGCCRGLDKRSSNEPFSVSAAAIAASGAEGLADSISPSVRVSDLLDPLGFTDSGEYADFSSIAAAPLWGVLSREATQGSLQPQDSLELYLCERLLPLLDDGIAALCEYIEKLQADVEQFRSHQHKLQHKNRQQSFRGEVVGQHGEPQSPRLLLGRGLHERFDPLVWLGQYILRQGKAIKVLTKAQKLSSQGGLGETTYSTLLGVRGEHIRLAELPVYEAVAAVVRDERGWRALEALQSNTKLLFEKVKQELRQAEHQGQEKHQEQEQQQEKQIKQHDKEQGKLQHGQRPQRPTGLSAENLELVLREIDMAWGLSKRQGFLAAVIGVEEERKEDDCPVSFSSANNSKQQDLPLSNLHKNNCSSILGACAGIPLEVADASDVQFAELWRFLGSCLEACPHLRREVFACALNLSSNTFVPKQASSSYSKNGFSDQLGRATWFCSRKNGS